MSWRWVIDIRGDKAQVDWRWLIGALVTGGATAALLALLLPGNWRYVAIAILLVVGIPADVWLRRQQRNGK